VTSSLRIRIIRGGEISGGCHHLHHNCAPLSHTLAPPSHRIYDLPAAPHSCPDRQLQAHVISALGTSQFHCLVQNIFIHHPRPPLVATRCHLPKIRRRGLVPSSYSRTRVRRTDAPAVQHVLTGEGKGPNQTRVRRPVSARSLRCAAQSNIYIRRCVQLLRAERDLTSAQTIAICDSSPYLPGLVVAGHSATRPSSTGLSICPPNTR
jgi:hypothetical protein